MTLPKPKPLRQTKAPALPPSMLAPLAMPLPTPLPVSTAKPSQLPASPVRPGLSLGVATALLGFGGIVVAVAGATALMLLLNTSALWAAAVSAGLGVLCTSLPLVALVRKLARALPPQPQDSGAAHAHGVPRALFIDLAEREFARARRYGSGAALLLVDVDRYGRLCEARGPGAGDAVLAELLRQTAPTLRPADVLTRLSDCQMGVFLAHADTTGALDVAERIRERTEQLEVAHTAGPQAPLQPLRITVSIGVGQMRSAHPDLRALVDDADHAVLLARQAGGNCVRAAPPDSLATRLSDMWPDDRRAKPKPGRPS